MLRILANHDAPYRIVDYLLLAGLV